MKFLVAGPRSFVDYKKIDTIVKLAISNNIKYIVHGGAKGVDSMAGYYGKTYGSLVKEVPADWATHGPRAGFVRNREMWEQVDAGLIVWDGLSRGTGHSISLAEELKKPLIIVYYTQLVKAQLCKRTPVVIEYNGLNSVNQSLMSKDVSNLYFDLQRYVLGTTTYGQIDNRNTLHYSS